MADSRVSRVSLPAYLQVLAMGFVAVGMLADVLAPRITVSKQSDKYRIFGRNSLQVRQTAWAPGAIPNAIETAWSSGTYYAEIHVLRQLLLDAERANNNSAQLGGVDLQGLYTQNVTNAIAIAREKRVADLFTNAANYAASNKIVKAGGAEWNVVGGEQIITDLVALAGAVASSASVPRSLLTVVIPEQVFTGAIMRNTAILDSIKYSQAGVVTESLLATLLGVRDVMISQTSVVAEGPEVAGADVITGYVPTYLWGDTVWVGLLAQNPANPLQPRFAASLNWTAATGGQSRQTRMYRHMDEGARGDWIEVAEAMDEKVIYNGAGGIITNTLSTI